MYDSVLNCAALIVPNAAAAAGLAKSPHVKSVEAEGMAYVSDVVSCGLDRVNQCDLPLDNSKWKANGADVKVSAPFFTIFPDLFVFN